MELGDVVEWDGNEIEPPRDCAFVRYNDDGLVFLPVGIPEDDMNGVDVYHVAKVWSVRNNGRGFEGYWLGDGWSEIELANPRKTYMGDGRIFRF